MEQKNRQPLAQLPTIYLKKTVWLKGSIHSTSATSENQLLHYNPLSLCNTLSTLQYHAVAARSEFASVQCNNVVARNELTKQLRLNQSTFSAIHAKFNV
jgi:hypothetical protein